MPAELPRVVLVEDDAAMQLYADTVLHELPIELVFCTSVGQALEALHDGPVGLVITDLMLPGESGIDLIERLRAGPAHHARLRVAVTSAALDADGIQARLLALDVWRLLRKPVAMDALKACVTDALFDAPPSQVKRAPGISPAAVARTIDAKAHYAAPSDPTAVDAFFGGDLALYRAYRAACLPQFNSDVAQGDANAGAADGAALRRLAHGLKSVLQTLGESQASASAERIEAAALRGDGRRGPSGMASCEGPCWRSHEAADRASRRGGEAALHPHG